MVNFNVSVGFPIVWEVGSFGVADTFDVETLSGVVFVVEHPVDVARTAIIVKSFIYFIIFAFVVVYLS